MHIPKSIWQNLGANRVNYGLLERTQGAYEGISGLTTKRDNLLFLFSYVTVQNIVFMSHDPFKEEYEH